MKNVYPPLGTLKRVTEDVWIVDGPAIRFGMPWPKMPFPTRMTVIRVHGRDLFIHSPTPLAAISRSDLEALGTPRWIIAPNRLHYLWIPEWRTAFRDAAVYLAPRIREQARDRIDFDGCPLVQDSGYPWDDEIGTLPIRGRFMTEVVFFHFRSRTLVLTDLIENFEPDKLSGFVMRWLTWLGGAQDPDGQMPRDMRLTYSRQELEAAVAKMIRWEPERILLAHGRWYETNGTAELRRAFQWLPGIGAADRR